MLLFTANFRPEPLEIALLESQIRGVLEGLLVRNGVRKRILLSDDSCHETAKYIKHALGEMLGLEIREPKGGVENFFYKLADESHRHRLIVAVSHLSLRDTLNAVGIRNCAETLRECSCCPEDFAFCDLESGTVLNPERPVAVF